MPPTRRQGCPGSAETALCFGLGEGLGRIRMEETIRTDDRRFCRIIERKKPLKLTTFPESLGGNRYQGENNSFKPTKWIDYATQFPEMISSWRRDWADGTNQSALATTPFGFVQIGPRDCWPDADHQGPTGTFYGGIRWAQTAFRYKEVKLDFFCFFAFLPARFRQRCCPRSACAAACELHCAARRCTLTGLRWAVVVSVCCSLAVSVCCVLCMCMCCVLCMCMCAVFGHCELDVAR